jgi:UDP-N-acetylmuramoylalanine--D-glutamate ligase
MEYACIPAIGITGTRGKSTTTHMIAAILEKAGKKVFLGGNVRGVSTLSLLPEVEGKGGEVAVLELDSWQCQGLAEAKRSPEVAVFTTFFPDHLNYYKGDLAAYLADKANIFLFQNEDDTLVLGSQAATPVRDRYQDEILADLVIANEDDIPADWTLQVPGEHNRYDAGCALAAARAIGVDDETSRKALEAFTGVPGRLQLIREVNGVKVYNDTNATTPEATIAALKALDAEGKKNVVLIMGGADKALDMEGLVAAVREHAKRVVLLSGTGTERILPSLGSSFTFDSLAQAVDVAFEAAEPGDAIVLSPAFASFGMFKNEYDRGDQFDALVKAYGA